MGVDPQKESSLWSKRGFFPNREDIENNIRSGWCVGCVVVIVVCDSRGGEIVSIVVFVAFFIVVFSRCWQPTDPPPSPCRLNPTPEFPQLAQLLYCSVWGYSGELDSTYMGRERLHRLVIAQERAQGIFCCWLLFCSFLRVEVAWWWTIYKVLDLVFLFCHLYSSKDHPTTPALLALTPPVADHDAAHIVNYHWTPSN